MQSAKMDQILGKLVSDHSPFNLLSPQRAAEVANVVRIFELRENEVFLLKPGSGHDYLIVIEGQVGVIVQGAMQSVVPQSTRTRPVLLRGAPDCPIMAASMDSVACLVDGTLLDGLVAWDGMLRLTENTDVQLHQQLACLRDSSVFRRMPLECVESAFKCMHTVYAKKGETVVRQGEAGDNFYIITEGHAELWQTGLYDDAPSKVADLGVGDTFGGEALLSGKAGSETVRIIEDATLLVLSKADFDELVSKELVRRIHPKVAKSMLETGYKALDVRYVEEYKERHLPGAILMPLHELNQRMSELNKDDHYIVYCRSGNRSAVAALKLTECNFDAASLEGGISAWPYEQVENSAAQPPDKKSPPAAKSPPKKARPAHSGK